jgi:hypothetical protein
VVEDGRSRRGEGKLMPDGVGVDRVMFSWLAVPRTSVRVPLIVTTTPNYIGETLYGISESKVLEKMTISLFLHISFVIKHILVIIKILFLDISANIRAGKFFFKPYR